MSESYTLLTGIPGKEDRKRKSLTNSRNVQELKIILFKIKGLNRRDIDIGDTDRGVWYRYGEILEPRG